MRSPLSQRQRQRGAAILLAMLMVSLVAMLSSAALWQQWRNVHVQGAEHQRLQAAWILQGTLDWARLILREDARAGATDHLAEPWAIALQEARLSTFLAAGAGSGTQDTSADLPDAFMSGQIQDMQARLNVTSLVEGGAVHAPTVKAFARLFQALGLPEGELAVLVHQWRQALAESKTGSGASSSATAALLPRTVAQLRWLGLSPATLQILQPHLVVLPERTPVNLNTASAVVLHAAVDGLSLADAQRLVSARSNTQFKTLADASKVLGSNDIGLNDTQHSVNSRYFEVEGQMRLGTLRVREHNLVRRDGLDVRALARQRVQTLPTTAILTHAPGLSRPLQ